MLYEKISEEIKQCMKAKNETRLGVLRMLKSKIMTIDARGNIPDEEVIKIIKTYGKNLQESLELSRKGGREKEAQDMEAELKIVGEFLPQAKSVDEVKKIIMEIMQKNMFSLKADMGKIMKELMANHKDIDGKVARDLLNQLLK